MDRNYQFRRAWNLVMTGVVLACTVAALIPLFSVLWYVVVRGVSSVDLNFFTKLPAPLGQTGGGMANALVGTLIMIGIASLIGLPMGLLTGIYLSEYGGRLATVIRFAAEVLSGVPSIVVGMFAYSLIVLPMGGFSAIAGGFALGVLMIPIVTRTTEEMLRMVPDSLREAALALGYPRWLVILKVVLPSALAGLVTGFMLAIARVAGETAPLLFTALGNAFWHKGLTGPISALPIQIYAYAITPFAELHRQAWAGAFVLIMLVLVLNIGARLFAWSRNVKVR